jgi:hypothetical protein
LPSIWRVAATTASRLMPEGSSNFSKANESTASNGTIAVTFRQGSKLDEFLKNRASLRVISL